MRCTSAESTAHSTANLCAAVLAYAHPRGHSESVALPVEHLDKVMSELLAVSRSATSKREEAANLARIWGKASDTATAQASGAA